MKRALCMLLCICTLLLSIPFTAAAEEPCAHDAYVNGFCESCDAFEPAVLNEESGKYEIGNAGQLFSFAALVNGGTSNTARSLPGKYKAKITLGNATAEVSYEITATPAQIDGILGENGWYRFASIYAPNGYTISKSSTGECVQSFTLEDGSYPDGFTYYLVAENGVRAKMNTAPIKVDGWLAPITVESITKDISAFIEITAEDTLSGIDESSFTIEWGTEPNEGAALGQYGTGKNNEGEDVMGFPITGLTPNTAYTVKVGVKDMAGNVQYQNCAVRTDLTHIREFTAPTAIDPEYTGEAQALVTPATAEGGTPMYRLSENESWSETIPTATEIGGYTVYYYFAGDENHEDSESMTVRASIGKTTPQAKHFEFTPPTDPVYDGEPNYADIAAKAEYSGIGEITVKILDENGEATYAENAGNYTVLIDVAESDTYKSATGLTDESWAFTVEKKPVEITVNSNAKTYGDADPAFSYTADGLASTDMLTGKLSREPGEDAGAYALLPGTLTEENNPNYILHFVGAKLTVLPRSVLVMPSGQTIKYGEEIDPTAFEITNLIEGDTAQVEPTASTKNVTKTGTVSVTGVKIFDAAGRDITENYYISFAAPAPLIIEPVDGLVGLTEETVTSDDLDAIDDMLEMLDNAEYEDETLEALREKCEALIAAHNAALEQIYTENVESTLDVTAENVKAEDKETLLDAKADLEEALETYPGNFTEEEKAAVSEEIERIEAALTILDNVDAVSLLLSDLPQWGDKSEEAAAKIAAAKQAYDNLTAYEKTLLPDVLVGHLSALLDQDEDVEYAIIKGNGETWIRNSGKPFSFTADGPMEKYSMLVIDKKIVPIEHYDAKSGSTIITLKESFLGTLDNGAHDVIVFYRDGKANGTFYVSDTAGGPSGEGAAPEIEPTPVPDTPKVPEKPDTNTETGGTTGTDKPNTPPTGDNSNIALYGAVFALGLSALTALLVHKKRRGTN